MDPSLLEEVFSSLSSDRPAVRRMAAQGLSGLSRDACGALAAFIARSPAAQGALVGSLAAAHRHDALGHCLTAVTNIAACGGTEKSQGGETEGTQSSAAVSQVPQGSQGSQDSRGNREHEDSAVDALVRANLVGRLMSLIRGLEADDPAREIAAMALHNVVAVSDVGVDEIMQIGNEFEGFHLEALGRLAGPSAGRVRRWALGIARSVSRHPSGAALIFENEEWREAMQSTLEAQQGPWDETVLATITNAAGSNPKMHATLVESGFIGKALSLLVRREGLLSEELRGLAADFLFRIRTSQVGESSLEGLGAKRILQSALDDDIIRGDARLTVETMLPLMDDVVDAMVVGEGQ